MTTNQINAIIDYGNNEIMSAIFNDIIEDDAKRRRKSKELFEIYDGKFAIHEKKRKVGEPDWKSNNKLPCDYPSIILEQGVSYSFGHPITYELDGGLSEKAKEKFQEFKKNNRIAESDFELATYIGLCGYGYRLAYIDQTGKIKVMNRKPWEAVLITDGREEVHYGMIYYKIQIIDVSTKSRKDVWKIEWYDKRSVYHYIESTSKEGYFKPDLMEAVPEQEHGFDEVPIIYYKNDLLDKGDFERVLDLINAVNQSVSDAQDEVDDTRNAYLKIRGLNIDEETLEKAKRTGAFASDDENFDIDFILKNLNDVFWENHLKRLDDFIYRFSKRVNMNDEKFSGAQQSGENRKWKMLALENDVSTKERYFTSATEDMIRIISPVLTASGAEITEYDVTLQFTRNLPIDYEYYGKVATNLKGKISNYTLLSILPFIDDVDKEIERMAEDMPVDLFPSIEDEDADN